MENTTGSLKNKAVKGILWTAVQKYSTMIVSFISGIILARLLTPEDYGCIGMLAIFMSLAEVFIDAGFGAALIQKKEPTQEDYSTVFHFNMGMSVVLYIILFAFAPAISRFYDMPILCKILRIQGLILFIYSLNIIQRNQMRKNLRFKKLSVITVTTSVVALIVTVIMAYMGCGVWALVTQNFIAALLPCIFFWITTEWHPTMVFSKKSLKELFGFGSYMLLSHIFNTISDKISGLLIGRWYNPATMGYYSKALSTENMASSSISGIMIATTYPVYAAAQNDKAQLGNMVKRFTSTLAYVTVPLLCVLLLCAKPIIVLLYSDKWLPCVPYFQVLCVAGMAACLQGVNHQVIAAIGKSDVMFVWTVVKRSLSVLLQVGGLIIFGLKGLLVGYVIANWFSYFVNISLVSKYVGYKNYRQLLDLLPIFVVSGISMAISYFVSGWLNLSMYPDALVKLAIVAIVYLGWSVVFKPEAFTYTFSIVQDLFKKRKIKK